MLQAQQTTGARPAPWRIWLKTARPFSLSAAVSPVVVGSALAAFDGAFHLSRFLATLLSSVFLQVGANYFNEYFDHRYGLDTAESLGASTVIFTGDMTANQVLGCGVGSFAIATLLGLYLIAVVGPAIILFGLAGLAVAYFYSARPFKLASRGLGDIMVYLAMGLLMTWGAYYVQLPHWSWRAFVASISIGCLVVAILNINNVRDYDDDLAVNKRTLPVRFGQTFGRRYQVALLLGAYITATAFVITGLLPVFALAVWLTFPLALTNIRIVQTAKDRRQFIDGTKRIALLHLVFGVTLALAIVLAILTNIRI